VTGQLRTERGFSRIVGFSDGVVAIAITLLVLPLVTAAAAHQSDVGAFLVANADELFLFVLTFLVIGRFWLVHHGLYENAVGYTGALAWANLLWLLSIVFLPVPTQLIGSAENAEGLTHGLYVGTMLITCLAALAQQWILLRHPELQAPEVRGTLRLLPYVTVVVVMLVSLVAAVAFQQLGLLALLLLFLTSPIERLIERRRAA
jgi:uncharacterized membrane protein